MRRVIYFILCISLLTSCVTKARYNEVLDNIKGLEKRHHKIEKQLEDLQQKNELLKDSAARGGAS